MIFLFLMLKHNPVMNMNLVIMLLPPFTFVRRLRQLKLNYFGCCPECLKCLTKMSRGSNNDVHVDAQPSNDNDVEIEPAVDLDNPQ